MPVFEVSALTTRNSPSGTDYVIAAFRSSTSQQARVREVHVFTETAPTTSLSLSLGRSTAIGTGTLTRTDVTTSALRNPNDSLPGTPGGIVTAWATAAPTTSSTVFMRSAVLPAAVGAGVIWTFDLVDPLIMAAPTAATSELMIVQRLNQAPGTMRYTVIWEE